MYYNNSHIEILRKAHVMRLLLLSLIYLLQGSKEIHAETSQFPYPLLKSFNAASGIGAIAWSLDGKNIAVSADLDRVIQVWNIQHESLTAQLNKNYFGGDGVGFSQSGNYIFTSSDSTDNDGSFDVWNYASREVSHLGGASERSKEHLQALSFSIDGSRVAISNSFTKVSLFDTVNFKKSFELNHDSSYLLSISPLADRLAIAPGSGDVEIISLPSGSVNTRVNMFPVIIGCMAWSSDGRFLAVGESSAIKRLNTNTHEMMFTHDSESIKIFDTISGKVISGIKIDLGAAAIRSLDFNNKFNILASAVGDGSIDIWSIPALDLLGAYNTRTHNPTLKFSPNGEFLAIGAGSTVSIFRVKPG